MKLNHDCVRAVMLVAEEMGLDEYFDTDESHKFDQLKNYPQSDIVYAIEKLIEANYLKGINVGSFDGPSAFQVDSITWEGHQFLDNIRDPGIWTATKTAVSSLAGASLSILTDVAAAKIKSTLGLG